MPMNDHDVETDERLTLVFDCLRHPTRRAIVQYLGHHDDDVDVTAMSNEVAPDNMVSVVHVHLPKLDEVGIVAYDGTETARRGPAFESAARVLDASAELLD